MGSVPFHLLPLFFLYKGCAHAVGSARRCLGTSGTANVLVHVFGSMWAALSGPDDLADGDEGLGDARVSRRLELVAVESILFKFQLLNHQKNRKTFKE